MSETSETKIADQIFHQCVLDECDGLWFDRVKAAIIIAKHVKATVAALTEQLASVSRERDNHKASAEASLGFFHEVGEKLKPPGVTSFTDTAVIGWLDDLKGAVHDCPDCGLACKQCLCYDENLAAATERAEKGDRFKCYTHERLTKIGAPHEVPESEHTKAGCRVGGRFDWVDDEMAAMKEMIARRDETNAKLAQNLRTAEREAKRLRKLETAVRNEQMILDVARACGSPYHDPRWCESCSQREGGIDDYQQKLVAILEDRPNA